MPDEILLVILALMPLKDAVVTGCVSKRWKFLWCNLVYLNFDGCQVLDKIAKINPYGQDDGEFLDKMAKLIDSERSKYINQVNNIIQSHRIDMVQEFRIRFDLDNSYKRDIDHWLQFVVNKHVETLELDLVDVNPFMYRRPFERYDFPLRFSTADANIVELLYLRKLVLKDVNVREANLQEILRNSPHLETLSIYRSIYLTHIVIGGEALNLKDLKILYCSQVQSVYLHDFNLLSFSYQGGPEIDLRLAGLPKIKELDISVGCDHMLLNNIFDQIASCVSHIQVLSLFHKYCPMKSLMSNSIPKLPNVKKLKLTSAAHKDNCLLGFTSISNACPSLETLTIELLWRSPIRSRRKVRHVGPPAHSYNHLRVLVVLGYFGRISDLELVTYIINNAVALQKVVIDPRWQGQIPNTTIKNLKAEETARSYAHNQLKSVMPQGVKLVIL